VVHSGGAGLTSSFSLFWAIFAQHRGQSCGERGLRDGSTLVFGSGAEVLALFDELKEHKSKFKKTKKSSRPSPNQASSVSIDFLGNIKGLIGNF
jgi:hypothetical protein